LESFWASSKVYNAFIALSVLLFCVKIASEGMRKDEGGRNPFAGAAALCVLRSWDASPNSHRFASRCSVQGTAPPCGAAHLSLASMPKMQGQKQD